jgi:predicted Zn-dependent protease
VIDNAADIDHVALARLLFGRIVEARRDVPGALKQARLAQLAAPSSQSVRMALARALLAHGDREGAVEVMADLPSKPPKTDDLWAEFLLGAMARFAPARAALYARVRLP